MTIEERLSKLEKQVEDMRFARDIVNSESIKKHIVHDVISAGTKDDTLTTINHTTTVPAGGGSVNHASSYDHRLEVEIDGTIYYIGLYD